MTGEGGVTGRSPDIIRNDGEQRYELRLDGELASYAEFRRGDGVVVMPHTYTIPRFRDRGLAEQVVRAALDDIDATGARVVPSCWFVADFIRDHPGYRRMLAGGGSGPA